MGRKCWMPAAAHSGRNVGTEQKGVGALVKCRPLGILEIHFHWPDLCSICTFMSPFVLLKPLGMSRGI